MKAIKHLGAISAIVVLASALAACGSKTNNQTVVKTAPPTAAELQQRTAQADAAFNKAMSSGTHPPASSPAAVAAFHNAMRSAYGAGTPTTGQ
jgi:hypothetical protein